VLQNSGIGAKMTIITLGEQDKATNNFDASHEVGCHKVIGCYSTVEATVFCINDSYSL
jgi:hypothetical protein